VETISRNPAGKSEGEINRLTRQQGIMVSVVDLEVGSSVGHKLRELNIIQAKDRKLSERKELSNRRTRQMEDTWFDVTYFRREAEVTRTGGQYYQMSGRTK
jgi:hypothetical protein